jgi:DNA-binding MarR family transcriptional regulator
MDIQHLDIIDLISERHTQLRARLESSWNQQSEMVLSNTEWHILAKINGGMHVISSITKSVYITRQATHKHLKNLQSKQLVEIYDDETNKRNKLVRITKEGAELLHHYNEMKTALSLQLEEALGKQRFETLQKLLAKDWLQKQ